MLLVVRLVIFCGCDDPLPFQIIDVGGGFREGQSGQKQFTADGTVASKGKTFGVRNDVRQLAEAIRSASPRCGIRAVGADIDPPGYSPSFIMAKMPVMSPERSLTLK